MGCFSDPTRTSFDAGSFVHAVVNEKATFAEPEDEMQRRLSELRSRIGDAKVDWYVVPSEDEHQSEEIGLSDERRSWISGFTGSAGTAIIPSSAVDSKALLFVDSRYWIQAGQQVPRPNWEVVKVGATGQAGRDDVQGGWIEWLEQLEDGTRVGIDPKLVSYSVVQNVQTRLSSSSTKLVPLSKNIVDQVRSIPPRPLDPIKVHPLQFAGDTVATKLARVRAVFDTKYKGSSWIYILPTLPTIAWLLNIRCSDIPFLPVPYAYLVLTQEGCTLFVDQRKVPENAVDLRKHFEQDGIRLENYGVDNVGNVVKDHVKGLKEGDEKKRSVVVGPKEISWALAKICEPDMIEAIQCPIEVLKGVKNKTEQEGFRRAYLRDGRAMVRWMSWLEDKLIKEKRQVGEWAGAQGLTRFRRQEEHFAGLAYDDISGSGPNGALPHYAPKRGQESPIDPNAPYVIDSGAQYLDGTIDTTRTLWFGSEKPSDDIKRAYTRVLQAHMAIARVKFPRGYDSQNLTMLGKEPLYRDGLEFGHGIGHGVGSYLAVHEYPGYARGTSFLPGHIVTVEPGFYLEGQWGIRTESVYLCQSVDTMYDFGGHRWLGWERVTQVPIQTKLVDYSLMTKDEIKWLNEHNTSVQDALLPLLDGDGDEAVVKWLKRECKPKKIWPWTGA